MAARKNDGVPEVNHAHNALGTAIVAVIIDICIRFVCSRFHRLVFEAIYLLEQVA
jgi:hypothetical protein